MTFGLRAYLASLWEYRRVMMWFVGLVGVTITFVGFFEIQTSWVPVVSFIGGITALFACRVVESENEYSHRWRNSLGRRVLWAFVWLPMLSPLSLWVVGAPDLGIRVAASNSTLNHIVFLARGFPPEVAYVVPYEFKTIGVDVRFTSKDGIPLRCQVFAEGVVLDQENPALESTLVSLAAAGPVQSALENAVRAALAEEAELVLAQRATAELERDQYFVIPYRIGSPLTAALHNNALRWSSGRVSFDCEVNLDGSS